MKQEREAIIDGSRNTRGEYYVVDSNHRLHTPPKPNWKIDIGNGAMVITHHVANPPNAVQRWLMEKLLGIKWRKYAGETK